MIVLKKKFLLCRKYEKDIWGFVTSWHKTINLGWVKIRPNVAMVPHLIKNKWLLQDFHKWLLIKNVWLLTFSFEIVRWMKKWKPKKMKNWMWFFFLIKILWIFYGNLTRKWFYELCKLCLLKKHKALFYFFKIFEFWLPMFIYWTGFVQSFNLAQQWVKHGHISVNYTKIQNSSYQIKLFDYITFNPKIWDIINLSYTRVLFYASWAAKWRKCYSVKYAQSKNWFSWAHFIGPASFIYADLWTFSLYWWNQPTPNNFKYYFSINVSNVIKHLTL